MLEYDHQADSDAQRSPVDMNYFTFFSHVHHL